VGEVAFYRGGARTATVRADSAIEAARLSRASMDRMIRDDPALAAALDRATINLLSERLDSANQLLWKLR
jgi:SulP family sulfate permease